MEKWWNWNVSLKKRMTELLWTWVHQFLLKRKEGGLKKQSPWVLQFLIKETAGPSICKCTFWTYLKKYSSIQQKGGRREGKKQNPRVLEFLFKELPYKGDDADVSQGCLCILDPKVHFFIWWYLLHSLHWYLRQSWWLLYYHLPIQLQHKLEHLEFFLAKSHYYNFD